MTPEETKRAAARERQRKSRANRRAQDAGTVSRIHAVPTASVPPPADSPSVLDQLPLGEFERAVKLELDGLGDLTAAERPGQAAQAIAMARILDNPAATPQHPSAAGQLRAALLALHEAAQAARAKTGRVHALRSKHVG